MRLQYATPIFLKNLWSPSEYLPHITESRMMDPILKKKMKYLAIDLSFLIHL